MSVEAVIEATGWDLKVAEVLKNSTAPRDEELAILRELQNMIS